MRRVGNAPGGPGGRAGARGCCHTGSHTGAQGQGSGSSSLTCWRSGQGASERPSQPQPLLGPITHHSPSGPQWALTWELAILPWERWLGFQAPATPFIRRDPWSGRLGKHPTTAGTSMGRKGEGSDPQAGAASRLPSWPPPGQAMTCGGF